MRIDVASVSSWYGNYRVPSLGTVGFSSMAAKGSVLINTIAGSEISTFSLTVKNDRTASVDLTDPKKPKIVIPRWYFDERVYASFEIEPDDAEYAALGMINGSICHEALHAYLTCNNLDVILRSDPRVDDEYLKRVGQLGYTCMNCIEDLYIESRNEHNSAPWKRFLDLKNSLLFKEGDIKAVKESFEPTATSIIGLLPFLKNKEITTDLYRIFPEYTKIFDRALETRKLFDSSIRRDRAAIAVDILKMFDEDEKLPDITPEDAKGNGEGNGEGEDSEGDQPDAAPDSDGSTETGDDRIKRAIAKSIKSTDPRLERMAAEFEFSVENDSKIDGTKFVEFVVVDAMSPELSNHTNLTSRGRYSTRAGMTFKEIDYLAKKLRFRDKIHAPGSPHKSGPVILPTRLSKAPIDGKIFAPRSEKAIQPPEIGILVDASGSMGRRFEVDGVERRLDCLFSAASAAAEDLHETLAGIPHFVVAHTNATGHTSKENEGLLVKVVSYGMNTTNTLPSENVARFERLSKIDISENFDGFAIRESLKFFTKQPRTKVLIVLSDGEPSAPGYMGSFARDHTKAEIQAARRQGIKVIAISLVREVIRSNNDIYGPRFNVDGTAGRMAASIATIVNNLFEWR